MSAPTRFTSGFTQAASFQPLGGIGVCDPFFYAMQYDDFLPYQAAKYTVTAAGGSVASTVANGNGGRILFTTGATATNFAAIQMDNPGFVLTQGKKAAFLCRVRLADITNTAFVAGLIQSTVTPFTITDGIAFTKAAASTDLVVKVYSGSTLIGSTTISGALTAATDIDLGFYVTSRGDIKIFYGNNLVGKKNQNTAKLGPSAGILYSALTAAFPTALLTTTLAVQAGTAAAQTMVSDFIYGAMER